MDYVWHTALISLVLFAGMLVLLDVGRRIGLRKLAADPEGAHIGTGTVDGAVFALLGLLIAFTFSGAATRFDERRNLIVQEANDIGTAYLRVNLMPDGAQPAMRDLSIRGSSCTGTSRRRAIRRLPWQPTSVPPGCRVKCGTMRSPQVGPRAHLPGPRCCCYRP